MISAVRFRPVIKYGYTRNVNATGGYTDLNSLYHKASFLASASRLNNAPADQGFEVAFAGRSNSGKSSAINTITQQKSLARVSKTPGRTQLLNFFQLDADRRLVDLPGYGYAKVPEGMHRSWGAMIESYLSKREALQGVFLIMDIRHPLTEFDDRMIDWCQHFELAVHIVLTKADKLSRGAAAEVLHKVNAALQPQYGPSVSVQLFSSLKKAGIDEAHTILDTWLQT
jgi:GTP-binding protein